MSARLALLAAAPLAAIGFATPAAAEEGMWTFDNFPAERMREQYGWAPDQAWLGKVQAAAVRLTGGCSASFVSAEGLILNGDRVVMTLVSSDADCRFMRQATTAAPPREPASR